MAPDALLTEAASRGADLAHLHQLAVQQRQPELYKELSAIGYKTLGSRLRVEKTLLDAGRHTLADADVLPKATPAPARAASPMSPTSGDAQDKAAVVMKAAPESHWGASALLS